MARDTSAIIQDFVPITYLLPADYTLFVEEFRRNPNVCVNTYAKQQILILCPCTVKMLLLYLHVVTGHVDHEAHVAITGQRDIYHQQTSPNKKMEYAISVGTNAFERSVSDSICCLLRERCNLIIAICLFQLRYFTLY